MVCRVSDAFIRFGTFQLPASREEGHLVPALADYVIKHHYPHLEGARWLCLCHLPLSSLGVQSLRSELGTYVLLRCKIHVLQCLNPRPCALHPTKCTMICCDDGLLADLVLSRNVLYYLRIACIPQFLDPVRPRSQFGVKHLDGHMGAQAGIASTRRC